MPFVVLYFFASIRYFVFATRKGVDERAIIFGFAWGNLVQRRTDNKQTSDIRMPYPIENLKVSSACFLRVLLAIYYTYVHKYLCIFLSAFSMTNQFDYALKRELLSKRLKGDELKGSWAEACYAEYHIEYQLNI